MSAAQLGWIGSRQALVYRRQRTERRIAAGLVPVRGARVVVGERVVVTGFDGDQNRLLEANRVFDVEAVHRVLPAPRPRLGAAVHGDAVLRRRVLLRRAESGVEVVLGAGAVQPRGPGLAVDEDHVVALAVPVVHLALEYIDVEVAADVMAAAGDVENDVVARTGQIRLLPRSAEAVAGAGRARRAVAVVRPRVAVLARRSGGGVGAVPPGVEPTEVGVDRIVLLVIDVEEHDALVLALVLDLEARAVRERHRKPTVESAAFLRAHLQRQRDEVTAQTEADAEKVAERHLDAGAGFTVPEHAQHGLAQLGAFSRAGRNGRPGELCCAGH